MLHKLERWVYKRICDKRGHRSKAYVGGGIWICPRCKDVLEQNMRYTKDYEAR